MSFAFRRHVAPTSQAAMAVVAAVALLFSLFAFAAETRAEEHEEATTTTVALHESHKGASSETFQQGTAEECAGLEEGQSLWHFVLNQLDAHTPAASLTATFQNAGTLTDPAGDPVGVERLQHFYITVSGNDVLLDATATVAAQSGTPMLVLSHVCAGDDGGEEPTGNADVQVIKKAYDAQGNRIDNLENPTVASGASYSYFFLVYNSGDAAATNVVLSDDLDNDVVVNSTYFDVDPGTEGGTGTCTVSAGNVVSCALGTLGAADGDEAQPEADSAYVQINVTTTEASCGQVMNQAFVAADNETAGAMANNASAIVTITVSCDGEGPGEEPTGKADVQILKWATDADGEPISEVAAEGTFRYVLVVFNSGSLEAENVVITDDLDDDLVIDSTFFDVNPDAAGGVGECTIAAGNVVTCAVGNLAPSDGDSEQPEADSAFARIEITVNESVCGEVTNQAVVSADNEPEEATVNNASEVVTITVVCDQTPVQGEQPNQGGQQSGRGEVLPGNPTQTGGGVSPTRSGTLGGTLPNTALGSDEVISLPAAALALLALAGLAGAGRLAVAEARRRR